MLREGTSIRTLITVVLIAVGTDRAAGADGAGGEAARSASARAGMVVTACPHASKVGRTILEQGGNAVDAAIAVGFALAVTYPQAGNIGGGGFMLVRMSGGEICCIDFREKAPQSAYRGMYLDGAGEVVPKRSTLGHAAVGVPGSVAGLYRAYELYGTMPWRRLLAPAVDLAGNGFRVGADLAASLERLREYRERFSGLDCFTDSDGEFPAPGDTLRQPDLARTLRRIADEGPDGFYRGETAALIVREMEAGGGFISAEDLSGYAPVLREPITGSYRGYTIISAPPPSAGGIVLLQILNIVEGYPLGEYAPYSERHIHILAEAERRAYADRARYLGDPDFVEIPVSKLLSKKYAEHLRQFIGDRATPSAGLGNGKHEGLEHEETTHYSIFDRYGNAVATTTTLNESFGSKVVVRGAGFLLNNEMDDFSVKPGVPNVYGLTGGSANAIAPGKRMLSSMSPTIVLRDDEPYLVLGTPGGSTIITTVAQVIINIVDYSMDPVSAVAAPRFHHQYLPDRIDFEPGKLSRETEEHLSRRGHACHERKSTIGDLQLIMIDGGGLRGVADPRGGGTAEGVAAAPSIIRKGDSR